MDAALAKTRHTESSTVWLSTRNATTHAHYDSDGNFLVQIVGAKRVWLWPPSAADSTMAANSRRAARNGGVAFASISAM